MMTQTTAGTIEINPIENNQGFILFESGTIQLPITFMHHCLTINITQIEETCNNLIKESQEFNNITQINYLIEKMKREMNGIHITKRIKRGLFNFVGSTYKYLFGTLDEDDRQNIEQQISSLSQSTVQISSLNHVIDNLNNGIEMINTHSKSIEKDHKISLLIFNIEHFTEYIEDIEMGSQLTRLGIFNPKLLKHDNLGNVNFQNLMDIKTSAWYNTATNEIFLMSHIPTNTIEQPTFLIAPYPDNNGQIINENLEGKFYLHNSHVLNTQTKNIIKDHCIANIMKHETPTCTFQKYRKPFYVQYIKPNIIITWNMTREKLYQNCNNQEIFIENNKIIKIFNCTAELKQVSMSNNIHQYTNLIFTEHNVTKVEPMSHIEIKEMIMLNNKNFTIYRNILIILLLVFSIISIFYLYMKCKTAPHNIIITYLKPKASRTVKQNIETETVKEKNTEKVDIENPIPQLYPEVNA